jgi:DNA-binding MarR family transcriptional regulator/GNAT superfamily N-acetyltransferase
MYFFDQVGKIGIGSRLRQLTELITEDAKKIYNLYDVQLEPHWFPVFYVLTHKPEQTITALAEEIGQSHPSVSKTVSQMIKSGILQERRDAADRRRNMISLTEKGETMAEKIKCQYEDVARVIDEIDAQAQHKLWEAAAEWSFMLNHKPLFERVKAQMKIREQNYITIIPYEAQYKTAFRDLNVAWISAYFKMETFDYEALDTPEENILNKGGYIFVALYKNEPVGVCALKYRADDPEYAYELAKMAVSSEMRGKNIGLLLGKTIIEKARELGAKNLFLESNTILKPAINLYHKLGFEKISGRPSPYERSNIQMALIL